VLATRRCQAFGALDKLAGRPPRRWSRLELLAKKRGALITVGASYIPFGNHAINTAVALCIACGKASLVAAFFMHLISERKMIYGLLIFTACFFLGLMFLTLSAYADFPPLTVTR